MTRRVKRLLRGLSVALLLALALFLANSAACPLPAPEPYAGALPAADPPPEMAVFQLPTGVIHRSAGFAYRGGSILDRRDFAMTALLVRHPRGDLLIDTGLGRDVEAHLEAMPWLFRAITRYDRGASAAEQLAAAGYDRRRLKGVVLTHAHWDHVSGLPELAGAPVWVPAEERRFIAEGGDLTAVARGIADLALTEVEFADREYLGFPRSHDVYGDGSVVIVHAPGHTPGSVIVFLALPDGQRLAMLGDLVWQLEGIFEREERPWLLRQLGDHDPEAVRVQILRVAAIAARFPEIRWIPAHDQRGFAGLPRL
ncbi:MAG: MBL fold metallo-hydrolase [Nannocystaceae bacterium]